MKNIILDTDLYNEIDDQIALAYVLKSKDALNLEAVTIAPFTKGEYNTKTSIDKSYEVAKKIFKMCNEENDEIIYKGAIKYFTDDSSQTNEAVNKIIQIASKNSKTYILSIGCITNIALAIKKEPSIINKIEVIWLGTNFLFMKNNDFNFRQDVEAVRYVLDSKVKITIIPTYPVSYGLMISKYELESRIRNANELCNYFCDIFTDDYGTEKIRRVIWDISTVAYMINEEWFQTMEISCPRIKEDTTFKLTKFRHKIKFVQRLNSNKIYDDLFSKITE
jgi:purine nucleosidase